MNRKIRILIADDHAIVRRGLRSLIETYPDFIAVGEAKNGVEAVSEALRLEPDVVVMDLMMPKKDGAQATAEIRAARPSVQVVILTSYGTSDAIAHALEAGAIGAVLKSATESELVPALRRAAAGKSCVAAEIRRQIAADPPVPSLTPLQKEILELVTRGLSNTDIARLRGISEVTVKNHLTSIFAKLGVATRAEAVALALRKHLLKI